LTIRDAKEIYDDPDSSPKKYAFCAFHEPPKKMTKRNKMVIVEEMNLCNDGKGVKGIA
jgi:hypothetical protein